MAGKQAKILSNGVLDRVLASIEGSATPERDRVIVLLSAKAGLRACEIAGLEWAMVLGADGEIGATLYIEDRIAKKKSGRKIPIHPTLRIALAALFEVSDGIGPVVQSRLGDKMRPNSIVNWFVKLYRKMGIEGCSSHSGRRTFITTAARAAPHVGGSLRDVQLLAGHKSLTITQGYIDGDTDIQRQLVASL